VGVFRRSIVRVERNDWGKEVFIFFPFNGFSIGEELVVKEREDAG